MERLDSYDRKPAPPFGEMVGTRKPDHADMVLICSNEGYGLKALRLCSWGQIYWHKVKDIPGLTLLPIRSAEYIHLGATGSDTSGTKRRTLAERHAECYPAREPE